jgi:hypothetical protein
MSALALDKIVIGGPCKITDPNGTIYTEGDVTLEPRPVFRDVESAVLGAQDKVITDLTWEITFKPKSIWTTAYRAVLLPSGFYNYAAAGGLICGTSNRTINIIGADGNGFDITRGVITQMPSLYFGLGNSVFDQAKITAFIGQGKALTDSDAFLVANTTAWSQTDYPTGHQEALCTLAWGSVTGFDTVYAEEGFKLTHELKTAPVKQGNITVDMKVISYRGALSFKPQEPTTAQLLSGFAPTIGSRRSANANNAIISGSNIGCTLYSAAIEKVPFIFDSKMNRHGEIALVTSMTGASTTRLAFT